MVSGPGALLRTGGADVHLFGGAKAPDQAFKGFDFGVPVGFFQLVNRDHEQHIS